MTHEVLVFELTENNEEGWAAQCICGWMYIHRIARAPKQTKEVVMAHAQRMVDMAFLEHRAQAFFADFAAETKKPHFGDMQRIWLNSILTRAIEAKLYSPEGQ